MSRRVSSSRSRSSSCRMASGMASSHCGLAGTGRAFRLQLLHRVRVGEEVGHARSSLQVSRRSYIIQDGRRRGLDAHKGCYALLLRRRCRLVHHLPRPIRRVPHQSAGPAHVRLAIRSRTLPNRTATSARSRGDNPRAVDPPPAAAGARLTQRREHRPDPLPRPTRRPPPDRVQLVHHRHQVPEPSTDIDVVARAFGRGDALHRVLRRPEQLPLP